MRSIAGVGITPPKVLGAPKPASSVMMSNTLGAPFGGTTRGAHHAFDSDALSLMTPPKLGGGGGSCFPVIVGVALGGGGVSCFPVIVVVALGEPGVPVMCWANAEAQAMVRRLMTERMVRLNL